MSTVDPFADATTNSAWFAASRRQLMAISALWVGMNFFWSAVLPLWLPARVEHFAGASKGTYLFYIAAIGAFLSTVVQLVVGPLSDQCAHRWGRRRPFIVFGVVTAVPSLCVFAGAETFASLMVGYILIQVFLNIATGPYQAVMPDLVPEEKHGLASAYMGLALLLGQGVSLPLAGYILAGKPLPLLGGFWTGWDEQSRMWLLAVALSVVLVSAAAWTVFGTREVTLPRSRRLPVTLKTMFDLRLTGHRDFGWLIASRFFINLGFYTATSFLAYYMADSIGLGREAIAATGVLLVIATFAGLLGNWPAGVYSDRTSKKRVLYITCGILAVSVVWFLFVKSVVWVYVVGAVFGIGWGAFSAVDWALAANLVPIKQAGRYMAIWHLAFTLPQVVAPVVGPVADRVNRVYGGGLGWRVALAFILVYLLLGVICVRFVRERPPAKARPSV